MEEQFKVGSVYVTVGGEAMRMEAFTGFSCFNGRPVARAILASEPDDWTDHAGARYLDDGRYIHALDGGFHGNLIPGELEFRDGQWLPISVTAPVVEEKTPEQAFDECLARARTVMADLLNAEMIARDGPARPDYAALERECFGCPDKCTGIYAPKSTAHPSIPSLSLSPDRAGADHRLGGSFGSVAVHAPSVFRSSK